MTIEEIDLYLRQKNLNLDEHVGAEIEQLRQNAIIEKNEPAANYYWCVLQIYKIQRSFLAAFKALKEQRYEDAWARFDHTDIKLSFLESNFEIDSDSDVYHLKFIGDMIKEYQKLFPYHYFISRECVIKAEQCSICGQPISLRKPCGHKVGKLYMGELCLRQVIDAEIKALAIVTDPFDKYTYLQLPDKEYDYGMLEALMSEVDSPYDKFNIETIKVKKLEYEHVGRNEPCPCGSGKKYKKCHRGKNGELMDHHIIHMEKPIKCSNRFVGTFGTWKLSEKNN